MAVIGQLAAGFVLWRYPPFTMSGRLAPAGFSAEKREIYPYSILLRRRGFVALSSGGHPAGSQTSRPPVALPRSYCKWPGVPTGQPAAGEIRRGNSPGKAGDISLTSSMLGLKWGRFICALPGLD